MEGQPNQTDSSAGSSSSSVDTQASKDAQEVEAEPKLSLDFKKIEMKPPPTLTIPRQPGPVLPKGVNRTNPTGSGGAGALPPAPVGGSATGNPRNKTALAPGHSLMDWIRLGSSGVDLTGVGGQLLTVTPAELAKHNKESDAWISIRGMVFNITRYLSFHPGGIPELMKGAGKDATKLFDDVHAWVNYQSILQKCIVGRLERCVNIDLLLQTEVPKPKPKNSPTGENSMVKLNWRQTSNTVTLIYSSRADNPFGECQMRRLTQSEIGLQMCLDKTKDTVTHNIKLAADVDWPPTWHKSIELPEVQIVFKKKERGTWKSYGTSKTTQEKTDRAKRAYNKYEVLENTPLCKTVHRLVLRSQDFMQLIPPGRHVDAKMNVMETEVSRPYTPVPCWLHPSDKGTSAATGDDCLCLMVKRYENGALSTALTSLQPGQSVSLSNALGNFCVDDYTSCDKIQMLAGGTGLTVMLPIMKAALAWRSPPIMNLINFNKNEENMFYTDQLDRVSSERTLRVTQVLSEPGSSWCGKSGRVSPELLKDVVDEPSPRACAFICGPPAFNRIAAEYLRSLGWQSSQMREFDG
ncbi:hypothetical protein QAD02_015228 [Eretmocerus hayati]|uniref:Uncharacterized protein n=1 Tax=Eretmocerus hayati TaxID=131215 RepID=A0ACC2P8W2_9HYME|nr:hypothetical protein QAD02_015228 [Eretmocerus hayati]